MKQLMKQTSRSVDENFGFFLSQLSAIRKKDVGMDDVNEPVHWSLVQSTQ